VCVRERVREGVVERERSWLRKRLNGGDGECLHWSDFEVNELAAVKSVSLITASVNSKQFCCRGTLCT